MRSISRALVLIAFAVVGVAPAQADMSGCSSASAKESLEDQIRLYTICLESGLRAGNRAGAHNNRGVAYWQQGDLESALADFSQSIRYDPSWGQSYLNRARIYVATGEITLAEADLDAVVRKRPADIRGLAYLLRGELKAQRNDLDGAREDFETALQRRYRSPSIYNGVAWVFATWPDASLRDGARAVELALRAVEGNDDPGYRDTLAAAYAEAGRFEDAVREQAIAMQGIEAAGGEAEGYAARLALYESGQPYRHSLED
jgi:tetratricopeptide (TPR) repeat protein